MNMEEDGGVDPRQKPFFGEITGENVEDNGPVEVESLCMHCERNVSLFTLAKATQL